MEIQKMNNLQDYMDAPYILTEEELRAKPLADVLEFTKYIDKVMSDISRISKIHGENVKTLNNILNRKDTPQIIATS
jgi:hypothetical protein